MTAPKIHVWNGKHVYRDEDDRLITLGSAPAVSPEAAERIAAANRRIAEDRAYRETTPPLAAEPAPKPIAPPKPAPSPAPASVLTEAECRAAEQMGITEADMLAAKARAATRA